MAYHPERSGDVVLLAMAGKRSEQPLSEADIEDLLNSAGSNGRTSRDLDSAVIVSSEKTMVEEVADEAPSMAADEEAPQEDELATEELSEPEAVAKTPGLLNPRRWFGRKASDASDQAVEADSAEALASAAADEAMEGPEEETNIDNPGDADSAAAAELAEPEAVTKAPGMFSPRRWFGRKASDASDEAVEADSAEALASAAADEAMEGPEEETNIDNLDAAASAATAELAEPEAVTKAPGMFSPRRWFGRKASDASDEAVEEDSAEALASAVSDEAMESAPEEPDEVPAVEEVVVEELAMETPVEEVATELDPEVASLEEPASTEEEELARDEVEPRRLLPSTLTLDEAVSLAVSNNVQLALAMMDLMAAKEDAQGMKAYMEPELVLDASMEEGRRKNTVEQSVSLLSDEFEEENSRYSAAIEGILPLGTTYRLGYDMDELANSLTNRTFRAPFDSQYTGFVGISVTQPLLRNFGLTFTRSNLINARLEEAIAEQNLRKQRMLTVANTVLAYWEVWMQQELVKVRLNSLENARKLQEANEQRKQEGKVAAIEVEVARIGVVKRETQWLDAHTQYYEAVNALANLLSLDVGNEEVLLAAPPITLLGDETLNIEDHLQDMWARHPDVQIKDMEIEVGELQLKVIANQRRPELNMVGSYGHNGLGSDWSESNDDLTSGDYDRWSIGLVFRVGMAGGQEMIHRTRKARINLERTELARSYVQKEIENRLRTTLRKVALLRDTVSQQEEAVAINQRALESEAKLLDAGKSKTARLLEVEEELLAVREDLVRVQTLYRRGLVEMRIANARILQTFGLE